MLSLSSKIAGFLEFIPRAHFKHLQKLHYKSLYSFEFEDPEDGTAALKKPYYFILFGPLSLCNSNDDINVSFFNFDDRDGSLLIWKSTLLMAAEETENDVETCTAFESCDRFRIADAIRAPNAETYVTFGISAMRALKKVFKTVGSDTNKREKVEFFVKVILHHRSRAAFEGLVYEADEEIFVKYNLSDPQLK